MARVLAIETAAEIAGVKVLIIGGTRFLGRRLVEAALACAHEVATFTRGRHNAGIRRDVADGRTTGVLNATGAEDGLAFGRMLDVCKTIADGDARFSWIGETYLLEKGVQAWGELPLWIPEADNGIFEVRNDKAIAAGLTFRPLADTVRDTLQWDRTRWQCEPLTAGLSRDREQQLLHDAPHSSH